MRIAALVLILIAAAAAAAPALASPPVWDRKIDAPKRFKVLKAFESAAVLDQETGLVWKREANGGEFAFSEAIQLCTNLEIGTRGGWRLPTVHEIRSLVPPEAQALPAGHPFTAPDGLYWTTTRVEGTTFAWVGDLGEPASTTNTQDITSDYANFWCVRGGLGGSTD
jgi:hypothetical protein